MNVGGRDQLDPCRLCRLCRQRCHPLPNRCRFLPLLPPITRNVKLPRAANGLEFGIRAEDAPDATSKSGKNGNVDHPSQLYHAAYMPPACHLLDAPGATAYTGETEPIPIFAQE